MPKDLTIQDPPAEGGVIPTAYKGVNVYQTATPEEIRRQKIASLERMAASGVAGVENVGGLYSGAGGAEFDQASDMLGQSHTNQMDRLAAAQSAYAEKMVHAGKLSEHRAQTEITELKRRSREKMLQDNLDYKLRAMQMEAALAAGRGGGGGSGDGSGPAFPTPEEPTRTEQYQAQFFQSKDDAIFKLLDDGATDEVVEYYDKLLSDNPDMFMHAQDLLYSGQNPTNIDPRGGAHSRSGGLTNFDASGNVYEMLVGSGLGSQDAGRMLRAAGGQEPGRFGYNPTMGNPNPNFGGSPAGGKHYTPDVSFAEKQEMIAKLQAGLAANTRSRASSTSSRTSAPRPKAAVRPSWGNAYAINQN